MAPFVKEREALEQAISGFGVDERSVLEIFKGMNLREVRSFESNTPDAIIVDRVFHYKPIAHYDAERMKASFLHFHKALEMWTKHPIARDACLMRLALQKEDVSHPNILVEVICTRTSGQLAAAKLVYQHMYGITPENQLQAYTPQTLKHKLLYSMLLVCPCEHDDEQGHLDKNVRMLFQTLRGCGEKKAVEVMTNETIHYIDMVLRAQYQSVSNTSFKEKVGNYEMIKVILKCRRDPALYFVNVIDDAFEANDVDAFTRVIVTRADEDMSEIKKAYFAKHKMSLRQKIEDVCKGCYKDFILGLMTYSRDD